MGTKINGGRASSPVECKLEQDKMKTISLALISVLACIFLLIAAAQSRPAADLIITNAKVWTVDKSNPTAQAVAVLGDHIVAVGSNSDVNNWRGASTRVIDAEGKLLVPGFNDSHVHFVNGGLALDAVQLNDATSPEECARRIGERAKQTPKAEWIMGATGMKPSGLPPSCRRKNGSIQSHQKRRSL